MKLSTPNSRSLQSNDLGSSATPGILRRILALSVFALPLLLGSLAHATLIWDGDANIGTSVFNSVQPVNGTVSVLTDPKGQFGKVYQMLCHDNGNTKARSEVSGMHNITLSNTGNYYIGWRSMWGPLPTKDGKWQVLSQIHLAGTASAGAPVPFGLSVPGDGMMHLKYERPPDGSDTFSLWDHALPIGSWHSFVMHIQFSESESTGYMEFWYDGVMQTMTNGKTRIPCAMAFPGCTSYFKWGVYRSGSGGPIGDSFAYLWRPRLGTTYADVDPLGGSGTPQVSAPTFSPAAGTYSSAQSVTITSATSGASIRYTTDGSTPSETAGTVYSGPVSISSTTTLKAIAYQSGSTDSTVTSGTYTINITVPQAAAPSFSPSAGTYASAQSVSITSSTSGASIRYTTDGSTPSETAGTLYSGTAVSISSTTTLKAIAYASGFTDSTVTTGTYTISTGGGNPVPVTFEAENLSPVGTGATASTSVDANASGGIVEFLNSTAAGQLLTLTTPSIIGSTYQVQLRYKPNTSRGQLTVKIDGVQVGGTVDEYNTSLTYVTATLGSATIATGTHSIVLTVTGKNASSSAFLITADTFTFTPTQPSVAAPSFSPAAGTYSSAQSVSITSSTSGASIRYTTDGSTPSETAGTIYSGPVSISSTKTLKAIAYASGSTDSSVTSGVYTITVTPPPTLNFEAESLTYTPNGATASVQTDTNSSGGKWIELAGNSVGDYISFALPSVAAGTYQVKMEYKGLTTRGILQLSVDGTNLGGTVDEYSAGQTYPTATIGTVTFSSAGTHAIRLTVTGKNSASSSYFLSADKFTLVGQ